MHSPSSDEIHKGMLGLHFEGQKSYLVHTYAHAHMHRCTRWQMERENCKQKARKQLFFEKETFDKTEQMLAGGLTVPELTYFFFLPFFLGFKTC